MSKVDGRWKEFFEAAETLARFEGRYAEFLRSWPSLGETDALGESAYRTAIEAAQRQDRESIELRAAPGYAKVRRELVDRLVRARDAVYSEDEALFLGSVIELEHRGHEQVTVPAAQAHAEISADCGKRAAARLARFGLLTSRRGRYGGVCSTDLGRRVAAQIAPFVRHITGQIYA